MPPVAVQANVTPVMVLPFVSFAVAEKVSEPPVVVEAGFGETLIDASVGAGAGVGEGVGLGVGAEVGAGAFTVTVAEPLTEALVAVTVYVPAVEGAV